MTNKLEERRANRLAEKPVPAEERLLLSKLVPAQALGKRDIMVILAQIVFPLTERESFVIASVWLGITGTLFLAYGLPGRENGPVRWFTPGLTCGLIRAFVFTPRALVVSERTCGS